MANLAIRLANSGEKLKRKRPHREMSRFLFLPASPSEGPPIGRALINAPCVCFSAQTGKRLLVLSLTAFDPLRNAYSPKRETCGTIPEDNRRGRDYFDRGKRRTIVIDGCSRMDHGKRRSHRSTEEEWGGCLERLA